MKFNWGTGIVLAFVAFISFIMYFVVTMNIDNAYNHDLVNENYYKKELEFQQEINQEENAKTLSQNLSWTKTNNGLLITFPNNLEPQNISGKVFLYRPSNKMLDFEVPITLSNYNLLIPKNKLLDGRWNITINWKHNNTPYLFKDQITY